MTWNVDDIREAVEPHKPEIINPAVKVLNQIFAELGQADSSEEPKQATTITTGRFLSDYTVFPSPRCRCTRGCGCTKTA